MNEKTYISQKPAQSSVLGYERERENNPSRNINFSLRTVAILFCFGFLFFGLTSQASAATYYWYGGSGNWSDYTNHWSTNSGNSPSGSASNAPLTTDRVIFDANSGAGTVTIDPASVTVANFDASSTSIAINDAGHNVTVNGDLLIINTTGKLISSGTWTQGGGNISSPNVGNPFKNLIIASSGGTTTMTGNVWVGIGITDGGTLTMGSGTLYGAGKKVYLYTASNNALTVSNLNVGSSLTDFFLTLNRSNTQNAFTLPNGLGKVTISSNNPQL